MPDRPQSTRPAWEPPPVPDAEADQPLRQVFARRLDHPFLDRVTAELLEAYHQRLETGTRLGRLSAPTPGLASGGELEAGLRALAVDLQLCAAFLRERSTDPDSCDLCERERAWCLLAGARAVEAEAVAERVERMLDHPHSAACPFPPGIEAAGIVPEVRQ